MSIFGVTGDLTKRLLYPSLYNLALAGSLPAGFRLIGIGRRGWTNAQLRTYLTDSLRQYLGSTPDRRVTRWLSQRTTYQDAHFDEQSGFEALAQGLRPPRATRGLPNRLFYLSVAPEFIEQITHRLDLAGLLREGEGSWARIIIEKPFGHDLASAVELNRRLRRVLKEPQIYRIDHYAGKDAVQDLTAFRFNNSFVEPLWHRSLIDSVQITACETVGVEDRAPFYEHSGALRDMVPNHLMELLSHIAMEPPVSLSVEHVRARQVEVLESIRPIRSDEVRRRAVRAQYAAGRVEGRRKRAYRAEPGVSRQSQTETFVALQLAIDNWRWSGVPFFLRTGKSLARSVTEIAVRFRSAPLRLWPKTSTRTVPPGEIIFSMKPEQGINLTFGARAPGLTDEVIPADMKFGFPQGPFGPAAKGYERPLRDAMLGNPMLFPSADFIEHGWKVVQPLLQAWSSSRRPVLATYAAGSAGPCEADALLARSGHAWRPLR